MNPIIKGPEDDLIPRSKHEFYDKLPNLPEVRDSTGQINKNMTGFPSILDMSFQKKSK